MMTQTGQTSLVTVPAVPFELQLLSQAHQYQKWVADSVRPYMGQRILEVGAGIGNMSRWLPLRERLVLSEGDQGLAQELYRVIAGDFRGDSRAGVSIVDLAQDWARDYENENFDTIVSFNVLEHIEDDLKAFRDLVGILKRSRAIGPKRLVTFVPAHPWAFGSIDRTFGHHRRYSKSRLLSLAQTAAPEGDFYARHFNIIGLPSWFLMNRVLKKQNIGFGAIAAFEKLCPWVRGIDDFLHVRLRIPLGQSLLAVLTL